MKNKFGLKTLIFVVPLLCVLLAAWSSNCLTLMSQANTIENIFGGIGLLLGAVGFMASFKYIMPMILNAELQIKSWFPILLVCFASITANQGCVTRVEPGYSGIKVNLSGDDKGVQNTPLVTGWVFYSPMFSTVLEYPTFVQTAAWTKDETESSPNNEEITFNSKENLVISADISLSYRLESSKVPAFYVKYRSDDLATFTHGYLRNVARDSFNEVGGHYSVEDLLGAEKEKFLTEVKDKVNAHMKDSGVVLDQFGFIGAPRPPQNVIAAINSKMAATQAAMQSENELRQAQAEAKKTIAKAQGEADSQIARATGAARAKVLMAESEASANEKLAQSITPNLLEWRKLAIQENAINKWNGVRPTVEGVSSGLMLQLPSK